VTEFSAFRDVELSVADGQRSALAGVTLSVRVVVVERRDTGQRWPFSVLMVTGGASPRPLPEKTRRGTVEDGDNGKTSSEEEELVNDSTRVHLLDVVHKIDGKSIWRPGALDLSR